MVAPATLVLEPPSPTKMPVPKLGSSMNKACPTHGVHMTSNLYLLMIHFVGEGGLDSRNAIQLLHTISSLYLVLKSRWKRVVS
jgi:hypothetical protein